MPTIAIQPATAPVDAPFPPASAQELLNFVAAYTQVSGLETLTGIVVGTTTPSASDRDKAWAKVDAATSRTLGIYVFNGGNWVPMPLIVPSGTAPSAPRKGELFLNELGGLQIYDGSKWTTNTFPSGATADRPKSATVNDLFFDSEISRLLRYTTKGWTTFDGAIGDIKMVDALDLSDAIAKNPGWVEFTSMANKFPLGSSATYGPTTEGGSTLESLKLSWDAKALSAQGGSREASATMLSSITLNGVEKTKYASSGTGQASPSAIGESTINLTPPYKALIFLRKDF